jgi:hypothetical protein
MEASPIYKYLKTKQITESSLKLYLNNLKRLNDNVFPKNYMFLKDVAKIVEKLEKYKPNTRRAYFISIVTALKGDAKQKKLYDKYYALLDTYNKEGATNNEKSETQKANWISQDEVKELYSKLCDEVKPLLEQKKVSPSEYEKIIRWVILSLYTTQKPRRNKDYQLAHLINKPANDLDTEFNYLNIKDGKWSFNNYKTKGTYQCQNVDATPEMNTVIKSYLKFHPLSKELKKKGGEIPFLVDYEGNAITQPNYITRVLNKIFGKKIGVSMLRAIFLTDKYGDKVKELETDATEMGTSSSTIQNQYVKTD